MTGIPKLKAPFPYFGGKRAVAELVWARLGDCRNVIEPFCGSAAFLLLRPHPPKIETINDADSYVANFWRATQHDPDGVVEYADSPVNECVPAGTMIATPSGSMSVEDIREGMAVYGFDGRQVVSTTVIATNVSHTAEPFVVVGPLRLTGKHPIWTQERGYVPAEQLTEGLQVGMICNHDRDGSMCDVRESVQATSEGREILLARLHGQGAEKAGKAVRYVRQAVSFSPRFGGSSQLLAELRAEIHLEVQPREYGGQPRSRRRGEGDARGSGEALRLATVAGEPNLRSGRKAQGRNREPRARLPRADRRQRQRLDGAPATSARAAGMGAGVHDCHEGRQTALLITSGHRGAVAEDYCRGRWQLSPQQNGQGEGQKERHPVIRAGLENLTLHQPSHSERPRSGHCRDHESRPVYNFQTISNNYFAAGILVHNCDLHARHQWLVNGCEAPAFRERMKTDPEYFDVRFAGWWVWGICCWIGSGWCNPDKVDSQQIPVLAGQFGYAGKGIHADAGCGMGPKRPKLTGHGVGCGVHKDSRPQLADVYARGRGVHANDDAETCADRRAWLLEWFGRLRDRLRTVRVCCGDWERVCGSRSTTTRLGLTGVFLDPPYGEAAKRAADLYGVDCQKVVGRVREWCVQQGDDPQMRIALCGYEGEHEALEAAGWDVVSWRSGGGYGNRGKENKNRERERIWFSPHCVGDAEPSLFAMQGEGNRR